MTTNDLIILIKKSFVVIPHLIHFTFISTNSYKYLNPSVTTDYSACVFKLTGLEGAKVEMACL